MSGASPRTIAHRGFAGVAPENSLAAFQAIADGRHPAEMIEFDVMPCSDGTVVIFHDTRLDGRGVDRSRGITDREGIVWETPADVVTRAHILGSDETIPRLRDALSMSSTEVRLNIELRNPGSLAVRFGEALGPEVVREQRVLWDPFVESVIEILDGHSHEVLLSSFFEAAIAATRDIAPEIPLAVNCYDSIEDGLTIAQRHECEAIHPRLNMLQRTPFFERTDGSVIDPTFGDIDVISEAGSLGADVNVWTVRTWYEAQQLAAAGVDGLIADYPGLLDGWARRNRR